MRVSWELPSIGERWHIAVADEAEAEVQADALCALGFEPVVER